LWSSKDAFETGSDMAAMAVRLAADLSAGRRVALGFECPLFIPIPGQTERKGNS
jgi:hypothetical protein